MKPAPMIIIPEKQTSSGVKKDMLVCAQGQHLACNPKYAIITPHVHPTCINGSRNMKTEFSDNAQFRNSKTRPKERAPE